MGSVRRFSRYAAIALLTLVAGFLIVPLGVQLSMAAYTYPSSGSEPDADYAIVLGASVIRGQPSPVLAERADEAVKLYQGGNVKKILVSGARMPYYDEVGTVQSYLRAAGIPAAAIILDPHGVDTYTSMYRARSVFHIQSATIVTQNFHMPRALFLARMLGIDAHGVVTQGESPLASYAREIPATWKALYDLLVHRTP